MDLDTTDCRSFVERSSALDSGSGKADHQLVGVGLSPAVQSNGAGSALNRGLVQGRCGFERHRGDTGLASQSDLSGERLCVSTERRQQSNGIVHVEGAFDAN